MAYLSDKVLQQPPALICALVVAQDGLAQGVGADVACQDGLISVHLQETEFHVSCEAPQTSCMSHVSCAFRAFHVRNGVVVLTFVVMSCSRLLPCW